MRSIGKRNIEKVKEIIKIEYDKIDNKQFGWVNYLYEKVMPLIPDEIFDVWEAATPEIDRIFDDTLQELSESIVG